MKAVVAYCYSVRLYIVNYRGDFSRPDRGGDPNPLRKKLTEQLTLYRCILSDGDGAPSILGRNPMRSTGPPSAEA